MLHNAVLPKTAGKVALSSAYKIRPGN